MSTMLSVIKIFINGIGFLLSYASKDNGYIIGMLAGIGLMLISIAIPGELYDNRDGNR